MSIPSQAIPRIFVSHSHKDNVFTARLVADLRATGADVWVDTDKITYNDFVQHINDGLANRDWLVLVQTPDALRAPWVRTEVNAALNMSLQGRMRGVIPVLARVCDPDDVPALWSTLHRYDATRDYNAALAGLVHALGLSAPAVMPLAAPIPSAPATPTAHTTIPLPPPLPHDRFPARLAQLGFTAHEMKDVQFILPPLCPVPAGPFLMGSDQKQDNDAPDWEQPQHSVALPQYQIARFPVTVAEYARFVRDGQAPPRPGSHSIDWSAQVQRSDHPVTCVTWHDAAAYAAWLSELTGQAWRLPSEAEWEKAARWDPVNHVVRKFPWGDSFDPARCNTIESDIGSTTGIGTYPAGASPCKAQDMAGNVWEWTSTIFTPYPYSGSQETASSPANRTLRGGAWDQIPRCARTAYRNGLASPQYYNDNLGFRLVLAVPSS